MQLHDSLHACQTNAHQPQQASQQPTPTPHGHQSNSNPGHNTPSNRRRQQGSQFTPGQDQGKRVQNSNMGNLHLLPYSSMQNMIAAALSAQCGLPTTDNSSVCPTN
eukprot:1117855-Ditylum_brightwellii.AAC.1